MMRTFSAPPAALRWSGSSIGWPYRDRIRFLEGYERSLHRRAAFVAARTERLRRAAPQSLRPPARLELDVPDARTRYVELPKGGSVLVHEVAGPPGAPTLILLHGWRGTAAGNWAPSIPTLAHHFRVIAPDLRGHDLGAVDDVVGVADALDIERFIAVGYSLGSAVASQLARRHPDRVRGVVLCAAAGVNPAAVSESDREIPTAIVVTLEDRLIPAWRQLELGRSLRGATVHEVSGNHFAFSRREVFVPVLLEACRSVAHRAADHETTV